MTFGIESARGERMKNALGRWSAQFQKQSAEYSTVAVMDPPAVEPEEETRPKSPANGSLNGHAAPEPPPTAKTESQAESAPPPEAAPEPEAAASEEHTAAGPEAQAQAETAGERKGQGFTRSADEQQKKDRGQTYERFEARSSTFIDYYEILQISRNADPETIHRVYRIMAARFHPDNPRTGDPERFQLLRKAYHVLSDATRRAEYDRSYTWAETHTMPVFELKEFVDGVEGEKNRRLGVLSLLYHRRRLSEIAPGISVLDLEQRMGLPREYLNFTMWYLKAKGFVRFEDNSDYGLTVEGVDYLEANSVQNTIIRDLLEAGTKGESGAQTGPTPTETN